MPTTYNKQRRKSSKDSNENTTIYTPKLRVEPESRNPSRAYDGGTIGNRSARQLVCAGLDESTDAALLFAQILALHGHRNHDELGADNIQETETRVLIVSKRIQKDLLSAAVRWAGIP